MIDEPSWPLSLSENTAMDEQRRCTFCFHFFPKDEMSRIQLDEPQNWQWVCEGCYEQSVQA